MTIADPTRPKFRLGLVLDSTLVSKYVFEFVKWSQAHPRLELRLLVFSPRQDAGPAPPQDSFRHMQRNRVPSGASELFFGAVIALEKLLLLKNRRHHNHLQTCDQSALLPDHAVHPFSDNEARPVSMSNSVRRAIS